MVLSIYIKKLFVTFFDVPVGELSLVGLVLEVVD